MADQLNILFRVTAKAGKEDEFAAIAREMMQASREEDGCITFIYHQNNENSREFMLYEQWRDEEAVQEHLRNLKKRFGEPEAEGKFAT